MDFSEGFRRDLDALFRWRRDVRRFRTDPVPRAPLDAAIEAIASAPSVGLSEPWRLIEVRSAEPRARVVASFERCNAEDLAARRGEEAARYAGLKLAGLREAPVHLAAFCAEDDPKGAGLGQRTMPEMKRYSVVCAVMQFWLAARAQGLGVGWVSILDPAEVRAALGAPEDWALIAYLCVGWPEEQHLDGDLERAGWADRERLSGRLRAV